MSSPAPELQTADKVIVAASPGDVAGTTSARLLVAHAGLGPLSLALLAVILGVVAGFGALAFRALIAIFHNLLFLGRFSTDYDTTQHTPAGPFGAAVAFAPAFAAIAVVFLVKNFAPEAKGHGVPEVMDAIYYKKGVIRPVVALVKSFASAISIGSGGSVGREGPIIQIGAAFGSWAGRLAKVSRWQIATLVAAGGGAGIAATFNTPIGGVLFAVEVLLHEVSVRTLVPVALATATATYVGHFLFGDHPAFAIPALHMGDSTTGLLLPAYVGLGCVMALVSVLFIRALYGAEDFFEKWLPKSEYVRHASGMLVVGAMAEAMMFTRGHYYVQGVGYATVIDVLSGTLTGVGFLLVLFSAKLVATSLTLGSGASGGVFSPALFMGATLGGAYGLALRALLPGLHIDAAALALAGMAGLVAGTTGAALTAIVMIFEMTLDYSVVLPMTLTVAVSYGLRRMLLTESVYTMKLARRGHPMPWALQANAYLVHQVTDMVIDPAQVVSDDCRGDALVLEDDEKAPAEIVLTHEGTVTGLLSRAWALGHLEAVRGADSLSDVARRDFVTVTSHTVIFDVLARMQAAHASVAIVLEPSGKDDSMGRVVGIVTKAHLAETLAEGMELFGD
jgi:CIC family chloride channel protein